MWGCGGPESLEAQAKYKKMKGIEINKMRKVDKGALVDDFAKEFLFENTFKHQKEMQDRDV